MKPDGPRTQARFMLDALALAARGQGRVEPNPMVGCVLVKGGRIVGRGWHRRFGGPHAEVFALGEAGRSARGATAYVTLEPCSHFGKTPPCADALIRAGIARVVAAMGDPNPLVSGRGFARLRAAGVRVEIGLCRREAEALAAPFITFQTRRRPYVILKWAQSIDGKIATRSGDSKWITSIASRRTAHALRARVDAVVVGVGTVLADNPELTARLAKPKRAAVRIVLDPALRTPPSSKLVRSARITPTILVVRNQGGPAASRRRLFERAGCEVLPMPADRRGIRLLPLLQALRDRGMTNVLVEGGGKVLGAFLDKGLADEVIVFVAPRLIGGETAPGPLGGRGPASMARLPRADVLHREQIGGDLCYTIRFK